MLDDILKEAGFLLRGSKHVKFARVRWEENINFNTLNLTYIVMLCSIIFPEKTFICCVLFTHRNYNNF